MIRQKPCNHGGHGGHGEHSEKQEPVQIFPITRWVLATENQEQKVFAVPAVLAVVNQRFSR